MEFNAYSMLVDFMWAGIFLFIAKILREKIRVLQSLFVPVSLLAGFIGLASISAAAAGRRILTASEAITATEISDGHSGMRCRLYFQW